MLHNSGFWLSGDFDDLTTVADGTCKFINVFSYLLLVDDLLFSSLTMLAASEIYDWKIVSGIFMGDKFLVKGPPESTPSIDGGVA